jgi:hypothetical protein
MKQKLAAMLAGLLVLSVVASVGLGVAQSKEDLYSGDNIVGVTGTELHLINRDSVTTALNESKNLTEGTYTGLEIDPGEVNSYKIPLTEGESINVSVIVSSDLHFDIQVKVKNPRGDTVDLDSLRERDESDVGRITYEAQVDGAHYLEISSVDADDINKKSVIYSLVYQTRTDRFEPNGALRSAPELTPGSYENLTLLTQLCTLK